MSELASYSIQAIIFALIAVIVVSRSKKTDLYQFGLISTWLIGVIVIYARYKDDQVLFYSNDQLFHFRIINYYLPQEGLSFEGIIGLRYLLTVPVYLVSLLGFNAMLVIKLLQLVSLLEIYQTSKRYLVRSHIAVKPWHIILFAGPIMIFMSLLALRDLLLALFVIKFVFETSPKQKTLGLLFAFLLRPHLGVALIVGALIAHFYLRMKPRFQLLNLCMISLCTYVFGSITYWFGSFVQAGTQIKLPENLFTQLKFTRLLANFFGLQFLTLRGGDDTVVALPNIALLAARLIFLDSFLIPMLFIYALFAHIKFLSYQKASIFLSFVFFYGVVSQTSYNSTRQNIPFLACMGLLAVADIEHFRKIKAKVAPKLLLASR
jgi:hypothetical protein